MLVKNLKVKELENQDIIAIYNYFSQIYKYLSVRPKYTFIDMRAHYIKDMVSFIVLPQKFNHCLNSLLSIYLTQIFNIYCNTGLIPTPEEMTKQFRNYYKTNQIEIEIEGRN